MKRPLIRASLLGLLLASATPCHAETTILHHWTLGEDDDAGTTAIDTVGDLDLEYTGSPASVTSTVPTSSLARDFANAAGSWPTVPTQYATHTDNGIVLNSTDNWGFECWVNLNSVPGAGNDSESTFIHIGDHGAGSAVIQLVNGNYFIHLPGVSLADSGIAASDDIGNWVHLALVNERQFEIDDSVDPPVLTPTSPLSRLFRNGVEIASTGSGFSGGSGIVHVGAQHLNGVGGVDRARGSDAIIDDVRVFEFELGAFDPETDLLYPDGPSTGESDLPPAITAIGLNENGEITLTWDSKNGEKFSLHESIDLELWLENRDNIDGGEVETSITATPLNSGASSVYFRIVKKNP